MNPSDKTAGLQDQIADLFFSASRDLDRYLEVHSTEITDAEADQLTEFSQQLRHFGDEFNVEAARVRFAAVQGALADLGNVTANAKQQLQTVIRVQQVISIAEAAIGLAKAISTGSLSGVGSALDSLAKAVAPFVEKAGAGGGPAPEVDK